MKKCALFTSPLLKKANPVMAAIVIFCFTFTTAVGAAPIATPGVIPGKTHLTVDSVLIPEECASVEDKFQGETGKLIIHIQDAHCIYDAQCNIRKIIDYLQKQYDLDLVALEGGEGRLDVLLLRAFPLDDVKEKVIKKFVFRGELSGGECAAILNEKTSDFIGVEDMQVYHENKDAFLAAIKDKDRIDAKLFLMDKWLNRKKDEIYSPELKKLFSKTKEYEMERLDLLGYLRYLTGKWIEQGKNLDNFPMIKALLGAMEREKTISIIKVENEAVLMQKEIERMYKNKIVSGDEAAKKNLDDFEAKISEFRKMKKKDQNFYFWLWGKAKENNIFESDEDFTELRKYLNHLKEMESIKGDALFSEIENLEKQIKNRLFENEQQRKLDGFFYKLKILEDLSKLELSREKLSYYKKNIDQFKEENFWNFLERDIGRLSLDKLFLPHHKFYEAALKRDDILCQNTMDLLESRDQGFAVLVTGGFHAEAVKEKLRENGVSYITVSPRIANFEENTPYWDVMQGKVSYAKYEANSTLSPELALEAHKDAVTQGIADEFTAAVKDNLGQILQGWKDNVIQEARKNPEKYPNFNPAEYTQIIDTLIRTKVLGETEVPAVDVMTNIAEVLNDYLNGKKTAVLSGLESLGVEINSLSQEGALDAGSLKNILNEIFPAAKAMSMWAEGRSMGVAEQIVLMDKGIFVGLVESCINNGINKPLLWQLNSIFNGEAFDYGEAEVSSWDKVVFAWNMMGMNEKFGDIERVFGYIDNMIDFAAGPEARLSGKNIITKADVQVFKDVFFSKDKKTNVFRYLEALEGIREDMKKRGIGSNSISVFRSILNGNYDTSLDSLVVRGRLDQVLRYHGVNQRDINELGNLLEFLRRSLGNYDPSEDIIKAVSLSDPYDESDSVVSRTHLVEDLAAAFSDMRIRASDLADYARYLKGERGVIAPEKLERMNAVMRGALGGALQDLFRNNLAGLLGLCRDVHSTLLENILNEAPDLLTYEESWRSDPRGVAPGGEIHTKILEDLKTHAIEKAKDNPTLQAAIANAQDFMVATNEDGECVFVLSRIPFSDNRNRFMKNDYITANDPIAVISKAGAYPLTDGVSGITVAPEVSLGSFVATMHDQSNNLKGMAFFGKYDGSMKYEDLSEIPEKYQQIKRVIYYLDNLEFVKGSANRDLIESGITEEVRDDEDVRQARFRAFERLKKSEDKWQKEDWARAKAEKLAKEERQRAATEAAEKEFDRSFWGRVNRFGNFLAAKPFTVIGILAIFDILFTMPFFGIQLSDALAGELSFAGLSAAFFSTGVGGILALILPVSNRLFSQDTQDRSEIDERSRKEPDYKPLEASSEQAVNALLSETLPNFVSALVQKTGDQDKAADQVLKLSGTISPEFSELVGELMANMTGFYNYDLRDKVSNAYSWVHRIRRTVNALNKTLEPINYYININGAIGREGAYFNYCNFYKIEKKSEYDWELTGEKGKAKLLARIDNLGKPWADGLCTQDIHGAEVDIHDENMSFIANNIRSVLSGGSSRMRHILSGIENDRFKLPINLKFELEMLESEIFKEQFNNNTYEQIKEMVIKSVEIHEMRHAMDGRMGLFSGIDNSRGERSVVNETSAYLAEMANGGIPKYQAVHLAQHVMGGELPHSHAANRIFNQMFPEYRELNQFEKARAVLRQVARIPSEELQQKAEEAYVALIAEPFKLEDKRSFPATVKASSMGRGEEMQLPQAVELGSQLAGLDPARDAALTDETLKQFSDFLNNDALRADFLEAFRTSVSERLKGLDDPAVISEVAEGLLAEGDLDQDLFRDALAERFNLPADFFDRAEIEGLLGEINTLKASARAAVGKEAVAAVSEAQVWTAQDFSNAITKMVFEAEFPESASQDMKKAAGKIAGEINNRISSFLKAHPGQADKSSMQLQYGTDIASQLTPSEFANLLKNIKKLFLHYSPEQTEAVNGLIETTGRENPLVLSKVAKKRFVTPDILKRELDRATEAAARKDVSSGIMLGKESMEILQEALGENRMAVDVEALESYHDIFNSVRDFFETLTSIKDAKLRERFIGMFSDMGIKPDEKGMLTINLAALFKRIETEFKAAQAISKAA